MKYPFALQHRKIIVVVKAKGPKGTFEHNFILDTGAGTTVIGEDMATLLGYDLKKIPKTETFVTAGGRVTSRMVQLHKMELFGKTVQNFKVGVMHLPIQMLADGLIGVDFLQKLKSIHIHFETKEVEVE